MQVVLENIGVQYNDRRVLRDVSTSFSGPGMFAMTGPSGSGKTTLLNLIGGEGKPSTGTVTFRPSAPEAVAWVLQTAVLLNRRTVIDNVVLGPLSRGKTVAEAEATALDCLQYVGIEGLAHGAASTLSGGEKQRVGVARAMATAAPLILADEPTASLDAGSREAVVDALRAASVHGALVLIATHDGYVASRCDGVFALDTNA